MESAAWDRLYDALSKDRLTTPESDLEALLTWVILNPPGPTLVDLHRIPIPKTKRALLKTMVTYRIAADAVICGVLPRRSTPDLPNGWLIVLRHLAEANKSGGETLIAYIPGAAGVHTASGLSEAVAKELVWNRLQAHDDNVFMFEHEARKEMAQCS